MSNARKGKVKDDTKERILLAAQKLFAEEGFESVSLRKITTKALANIAAVNYHFGSKDALIDEVIIHHTLPVMSARMCFLDEAEQKFQVGVVPVAVVLDAFMRPFLMAIKGNGENREMYCKFMGRCMSERGDKVPGKVVEETQKVMKRVTRLLSNTLPDITPEVLSWRLHFCFGVMAHTLVHENTLKHVSKGASGDPDFETTLERVIDFCKGGLEVGEAGVAGGKSLVEKSGGQSEFLF